MTKEAMGDLVSSARAALNTHFERLAEKADELEQELAYAHAQREDAEAREQALAAHVERLATPSVELANTVENRDDLPIHKWALKCARLVTQVQQAANDTPTTSLARRDAEQRKIGAASFKAELHEASTTPVRIHAEGVFAVWLRRQAEAAEAGEGE